MKNKYHTKSLMAAITVAGLLFSATAAHAAVFTWTGAVDSDWENAANWDANGVPVDSDPSGAGLGFASSADDRIVINATNFSPTTNVPTLYATLNTSVTPNVDVINGSAAFNLNSSISGQHLLNANASVTIGDGNLSNGLASLTYNNPGVFRRDANFNYEITVNSDGSLNFGANTTVSFDNNKTLSVILAGGSVNFDGWVRMVRNDTGTGNSFFDFTEEGASFNASFGGFFADIEKVNTVIASGVDGFFNLRSSAGLTLAATDHGDGTFTVAAIPEPSSALLLGLAGMSLILRRRRR